MRATMILMLLLSFLQARPALAGKHKVIVVTLGGVLSTDIHGIVKEIANDNGYRIKAGENWTKTRGDKICAKRDAKALLKKINKLVEANGGKKSELTLLVIGKSAGGVLAWNTFKRHYDNLKGFKRLALVTIDPHGAVTADKEVGPYCKRQDLAWQDEWSSDKSFLKVFNIYQWEKALTGASFPDRRVHRNVRITQSGINHDNIPSHAQTAKLIKEALVYVFDRK